MTFSCDATILPARCRTIFQLYIPDSDRESYFGLRRGGDVGLAVFFKALYDSNIVPHRLDPATNLDWDTITTFTEAAVIHRVCRQVEVLILRHKYSTEAWAPKPYVALNSDGFPKLRNLTLDYLTSAAGDGL